MNIRLKFLLPTNVENKFIAVKADSPGLFLLDVTLNEIRFTSISVEDWRSNVKLIKGSGNTILAVTPTGNLIKYYLDENHIPTQQITLDQGNWDSVTQLCEVAEGEIYTIDTEGKLFFYRYDLINGVVNWTISAQSIQGRLLEYSHAYAINGKFYHFHLNGDLTIHEIIRTNDGVIHINWENFDVVSFGRYLYIIPNYEINNNFFATFICISAHEFGTDIISMSTDLMISILFKKAFNESYQQCIQICQSEGFCFPLSSFPNDVINFYFSSEFQNTKVKVEFLNLKEIVTYDLQHEIIFSNQYGVPANPVATSIEFVCGYKNTANNVSSEGCNWPLSFSFRIPDNWESGFYIARCKSVNGLIYDIPFVVKTRVATSKFLVIANVNTWNAYNNWGGESNYTIGGEKQVSFKRPNYSLLFTDKDHSNGNHLIRSEIWFLDWLSRNGYSYNLITDVDFELIHPDYLLSFEKIILSSHPEYWSQNMAHKLQVFESTNTKSVIYLGGNGIFRRVEYNLEHSNFLTDRDDNHQLGSRAGELHNHNLLGVTWPGAVDRNTSFSLQNMQSENPPFKWLYNGLIAGNIIAGSIARTSINGVGAHGWETDVIKLPTNFPNPNWEIYKIGISNDVRNCSMVLVTKFNACGFIFSAGSISFVDSLIMDKPLQQITKNLLNHTCDEDVINLTFHYPEPKIWWPDWVVKNVVKIVIVVVLIAIGIYVGLKLFGQ